MERHGVTAESKVRSRNRKPLDFVVWGAEPIILRLSTSHHLRRNFEGGRYGQQSNPRTRTIARNELQRGDRQSSLLARRSLSAGKTNQPFKCSHDCRARVATT